MVSEKIGNFRKEGSKISAKRIEFAVDGIDKSSVFKLSLPKLYT